MRTFSILLTITIFSGIVYFTLDRQLFYYGKNDFNFYHLLPLDIVPEDRPDFENGFALKDKYGLTIAAKGNAYKFNDEEVLLDKILSYCYNTDKVVAKVIDENNKEYFIEFTGNADKKANQDIIANILENNKAFSSSEFKCVSIKGNERKIKQMVYPRNYLMFIFIILFLVTTYNAIKLLRIKC